MKPFVWPEWAFIAKDKDGRGILNDDTVITVINETKSVNSIGMPSYYTALFVSLFIKARGEAVDGTTGSAFIAGYIAAYIAACMHLPLMAVDPADMLERGEE